MGEGVHRGAVITGGSARWWNFPGEHQLVRNSGAWLGVVVYGDLFHVALSGRLTDAG